MSESPFSSFATSATAIAFMASPSFHLKAESLLHIEVAHSRSAVATVAKISHFAISTFPVDIGCLDTPTTGAALATTCADASSSTTAATAAVTTAAALKATTFIPITVAAITPIATIGSITTRGNHLSSALQIECAAQWEKNTGTGTVASGGIAALGCKRDTLGNMDIYDRLGGYRESAFF